MYLVRMHKTAESHAGYDLLFAGNWLGANVGWMDCASFENLDDAVRVMEDHALEMGYEDDDGNIILRPGIVVDLDADNKVVTSTWEVEI